VLKKKKKKKKNPPVAKLKWTTHYVGKENTN
jgi:hypothetical protein